MLSPQAKKQAKEAENLVRRSRAGDQVATDTILMVAKNAQKGNPTAKSALQCIQEYIRSHPVSSPMGSEELSSISLLMGAERNPPEVVANVLCRIPQSGNLDMVPSAIVALSNACLWDKNRVSLYDSMFGGDSNPLWRFGFAYSSRPEISQIHGRLDANGIGIVCAGHCIGTARKIQLARLKNMPLSVISPQIGWELGC